MTKKPSKALQDIVFLSQYERYLRGKISYRELHNLDDEDAADAREKATGGPAASAVKTRRASRG
jgi:hypothetical protein